MRLQLAHMFAVPVFADRTIDNGDDDHGYPCQHVLPHCRRTSDPSEALLTVPRMWAGQHMLLPRDAPNRHGLPRWCTRVAALGLNRYVFGFGLLPLRDGHLQDAILELSGGVLRLDGRRQGDGPREC